MPECISRSTSTIGHEVEMLLYVVEGSEEEQLMEDLLESRDYV
jgi:hypothetical protein